MLPGTIWTTIICQPEVMASWEGLRRPRWAQADTAIEINLANTEPAIKNNGFYRETSLISIRHPREPLQRAEALWIGLQAGSGQI